MKVTSNRPILAPPFTELNLTLSRKEAFVLLSVLANIVPNQHKNLKNLITGYCEGITEEIKKESTHAIFNYFGSEYSHEKVELEQFNVRLNTD